VHSCVQLDFDRGTLVLSGCPESVAAQLPGLLWDVRIQAYRAPGYRYSDLLAALAQSGRNFSNRVPFNGSPPATWKDVELRPYQAAALASWELSGSRGLIILPTGAGKTRLAGC